jgi:GxxExxY protein
MTELLYEKETYQIIGKCFEVHNSLGPGFLEIVYKDALEYEFELAGIPYSREKRYEVSYKDIVLPHVFHADFVVFDKIILEVMGIRAIYDEYIARTINYLKVSENKVGLLVNFGELQLQHKRLIFDKKLREWKKK